MQLRFINHYKLISGLRNRWLHDKYNKNQTSINCEDSYVGIAFNLFLKLFPRNMSNGENSTEPKRANIIIINRLSESFPLYHLHQLSARSASPLRCVCVCARALAARAREKWAKAPPRSKKARGKKRKSKLIHTSQFWQEEKNRSVYEPYK